MDYPIIKSKTKKEKAFIFHGSCGLKKGRRSCAAFPPVTTTQRPRRPSSPKEKQRSRLGVEFDWQKQRHANFCHSFPDVMLSFAAKLDNEAILSNWKSLFCYPIRCLSRVACPHLQLNSFSFPTTSNLMGANLKHDTKSIISQLNAATFFSCRGFHVFFFHNGASTIDFKMYEAFFLDAMNKCWDY